MHQLCLPKKKKVFLTTGNKTGCEKKRIWRQLAVGLPLGAAFAGAILVNVYSGWNAAGAYLKHNAERLLIVMAAVLLTVIFIVIFSARHRWDMNEQRYKELMAKKDKP